MEEQCLFSGPGVMNKVTKSGTEGMGLWDSQGGAFWNSAFLAPSLTACDDRAEGGV